MQSGSGPEEKLERAKNAPTHSDYELLIGAQSKLGRFVVLPAAIPEDGHPEVLLFAGRSITSKSQNFTRFRLFVGFFAFYRRFELAKLIGGLF